MKTRTLPIIMICAIILALATITMAQTATSKVIDIYWQTTGAEPDVQYYQLYTGPSDTELQAFGDPIPFNPNATDAPEQIQQQYDLEVPADAEVTQWFSVTAIDTSGNESALATPVSVTVDNQAPGAPTGLTVTVRVIPVTQ